MLDNFEQLKEIKTWKNDKLVEYQIHNHRKTAVVEEKRGSLNDGSTQSSTQFYFLNILKVLFMW